MRLTEPEKALLPFFHNPVRFPATHSPIGIRKLLVWADTGACGRTKKTA